MKILSVTLLTLFLSVSNAWATVQSAPCNNAANAIATATLAANSILKWYVTGYQITTGGATTATGGVNATITGLVGGTINISVAVGSIGSEVIINGNFIPPLEATNVNTAVVISVPAIGIGNTQSSCALFGELR